MHILLVPNGYPTEEHPFRGVFFKMLAEALHREGVKVGVIAPDVRPFKEQDLKANPIRKFNENGIPVLTKRGYNRIPISSHYQRAAYDRIVPELYRAYGAEFGKPDLLHAHVALWAGWATSQIGTDYVITEHSSQVLSKNLTPKESKCALAAYNSAKQIFAVSSALAKAVRSYTSQEVKVLPNPVDTEFFSQQLADPSSSTKLVTVASLNENKGVHLIIQALSALRKTNENLTLDVIGDGAQRKELEDLSSSLGVSDVVKFHGFLQPEEIRKIFQRSSVFVSASQFETFGVAIAEALATGLPIVTTRSGGPEDLVNDSNGILVDRTVDDLTEAIGRILSDRSRFNPVEISGKIGQLTGKQSVAKKYISAYQRIISQ